MFGVGMVVVEAVSEGKHKVNEVRAYRRRRSPCHCSGSRSHLEGRDLGAMQSLQIDRRAPDRIEAFHLTVKLNDGVGAEPSPIARSSLADAARCGLRFGRFRLSHRSTWGTRIWSPSGRSASSRRGRSTS